MLVYEFRVILPMTVEEYQVAQLFSVAEASKNETGGGEGIEVIKNEPFEDKEENRKGQYTYKIYHLESRVPKFLTTFAPKGSLQFHEEAWNAYPYCKTIVTNPGYMKDGFLVQIETWHKPDLGDHENVHNLPAKEWEKVHKVKIDIANDHVKAGDYKEEFDPTKFHSKKAKRGPLGKTWINDIDKSLKGHCNGNGETTTSVHPHMCAYKLVTCNFKWWGLQGRVEKMIQNQERRLFTTFHRQVFCWMDQWYGLTMDDIRELEHKTKLELDKMRHEGEKQGMQVHED